MTRRGGNGEKGGSGEYEVGYRKPPRNHQFPAGVSGNAAGRPKGSASKHNELRVWDRPTRELLVQEGQRLIEVTEGGKRIKMPAQQAVIRAAYVAALKGSSHAQKTLIQHLDAIEEQAWNVQDELIEGFGRYKAWFTPERMDELGVTDKLVPHPDDIIVDRTTRTIEFGGPLYPHQKAALDRLLERRDLQERGVDQLLKEADASPADGSLIILAWEAQYLFDYINDRVPKRCRAKLRRRVGAAEYTAAVKRFKCTERKKEARRRRRRKRHARSDGLGERS